jgi:uncharacterized membrane protein YfcA
MVPLLLNWLGMPLRRALGTSLAAMLAMVIPGTIVHAVLGHVDWLLLSSLLIGSLPGIWIGAQLTKAFPERLVRTLLCVSLVTAGLKVMA